jgi:3-deoxy-7-phosphoheptulonate synthase
VRTVVAAVGDETTKRSLEILGNLPMVEKVIPIQRRYKLVSREAQPEPTLVRAGRHVIGGKAFHVIAGPCSVESLPQTAAIARAVAAAGATLLRGGAYKPRTSPYDFQGLGADGLRILRAVKEETGLPVVSEVINERDLYTMVDTVDVLQIGARNAMNYSLLEAVAKTGKPVLLKRGLAATVEEWLLAAEYLAKNGNPQVILCERGIRTFERATRNTLDLSAVVIAKLESNLPVFVDPSHAAGRHDLVPALSRAAVAAGADGLMIEVHGHPERASSDGTQQLTPPMFQELMASLKPFLQAAGRTLCKPTSQPACQRELPKRPQKKGKP